MSLKMCCVEGCSNLGRFTFPKSDLLRQQWLIAIRKPTFVPKVKDGICEKHFKKTDLHDTRYDSNLKATRIRLPKLAVPSIFPWTSSIQECEFNFEGSRLHFNHEMFFDSGVGTREEIIKSDLHSETSANDNESIVICQNNDAVYNYDSPDQVNVLVDSDILNMYCENGKNEIVNNHKLHLESEKTNVKSSLKPRYDIDDFVNKPKVISAFTGLENYEKFMTVLYSLGKKVYNLKYCGNGEHGGLSIKNQVFLTLWKLRKNCSDFELSVHFNISESAVRNIFKTMIVFMAKQWSKIDLFPSKELVQYYMPKNFKRHYPTTRIIIDGTESKIQRPGNPKLQKSSFSTYKNDNTFKTVVGNTPGGLFSFYSDSYGGSTSDRQVVERCDKLLNSVEAGDSIMADRGFTVQDIFASKNVTVLMPHHLKGKNYLPHKHLMKDRKLSKFRVHVERMIGLLKTYKMLSTKLNHAYRPLAKEITGVCIMLCNFKECIMKNK